MQSHLCYGEDWRLRSLCVDQTSLALSVAGHDNWHREQPGDDAEEDECNARVGIGDELWLCNERCCEIC